MQNPNNTILVHFPNGQSRRRNAQTTFVPDDRVYPKPVHKAHADLYSRVDYSLLKNNELRRRIDQQSFDNGNDWPVIALLAAVLLTAGLFIYLIVS